MASINKTKALSPFVDESEAERFQSHESKVAYLWLVIHELLGHGTGQMMVQESDTKFNFDPQHPPINPLTSRPIECWYRPGETWTGKFGDLSTTVDECRCELVGACLMDNKELLALFGFDEHCHLKAEDCKKPSERLKIVLTN